MSDLIDRAAANAALEKLDELMRHRAETEDKEFVKVQVGITLARCEIDAMPTIEAAPVVHARWMQDDTLKDLYFCSKCLTRDHRKPKHKFCPDCGARMDADAPERAGKDGRDG